MSDLLGQRVRFTHVLKRHGRPDSQRVTAAEVRRWDPWPQSGEGIIFGKRVLSNGHVERDTEYDEWTGRTYMLKTWVGVHHFTAYLVAFDLRRKPVIVLPEHLEIVDD